MNYHELQIFFDQSQDIVALLDRDLKYVIANHEYCRYWGVPRETVLQSTVEEVVGKRLFDSKIVAYMDRCLAGESVHFERWLDFPGMGRRHMDVRYTPHRDDEGEVVGIFFISRDTTECMNHMAEIQEERDKFDSILTSLNVGVVLYNSDLSIEWVNEQMLKDHPGSDLCGCKCYKVFMNNESPCADCPTLETFRTGKTCYAERYNESNGRWDGLTTMAIKDDNGKVSQVLGHVENITKQKESMEILKAREAELASIFRATPVGIGVVKDRVFVQGNDELFKMVGYTREELIGQNSRIVYPSLVEYESFGEFLYTQIETSCTAGMEGKWERKDGSQIDVLINITAMHPDNPAAGATFAVMDITALKRVEEAVRKSEQRFKDLFEDVNMIAVQGYDEDRRVVYWNPASEQLYGYSREEALGEPLEDLIIPDPMREPVIQGHDAWVNKGIPIPAAELELVGKDGGPVPVYSSHVMQKTTSGEKTMYCLDVDLTEIKRIHNQLVLAKEEAEAANMAKSEFLANMSHEIRTPLNGIQGMLTLLQTTDLDDSQQEYAQAGVDSAIRLNRLLSDILDLSRVEAGKMVVEKKPFDLPAMLHQVETLFSYSFQEAGIELESRVDENVPKCMLGDSARLQQVLINLVGNALKYTESGTVFIDVSMLSPLQSGVHRVYFTISDTGIGINQAKQDTLFEPFVQGSQGYSRQYQGAGLGLSICKRLVDLMGGSMSMESTSGAGTTIHLMMPMGSEECLASGDMIDAEIGADIDIGLNVLLAEDDNTNLIVAKRLLEKAGCSVSVAGSGGEALDMVRDGRFDAVFMDVQMPVMDGVEATRQIREGKAGDDVRDIPIFALTAYTMAGDREAFMASGMDGYIPKPVEMFDLLRALKLAIMKIHGTDK